MLVPLNSKAIANQEGSVGIGTISEVYLVVLFNGIVFAIFYDQVFISLLVFWLLIVWFCWLLYGWNVTPFIDIFMVLFCFPFEHHQHTLNQLQLTHHFFEGLPTRKIHLVDLVDLVYQPACEQH